MIANVAAVVVAALLVGSVTGTSASTRRDLKSSSKPLLVAFDGQTGKQQWQRRGDHAGHFSVLGATSDGVIVMHGRCLEFDRDYESGDSSLVAFDAKTGREQWHVPDVTAIGSTEAEYIVPAVLAGSWSLIPVLSADRQKVRALDPRTGRQRWRVPSLGLVPVAQRDDFVVLASRGDVGPMRIAVLAAKSGELRWSSTIDQSSVAHITAGSDAVVVIGRGSAAAQDAVTMHVLDVVDGTTTLTAPVVPPSSNGFVIAGDAAILAQGSAEPLSGSSSWHTFAYSLTTGTQLWDAPGWLWVVGRVGRSPAVFGATSFVSSAGRAAAVDAHTGETLWQVESPGYPIGISSKKLVVGNAAEYGGSYSVVDSIGALDRATGALIWSEEPGRRTVGPGTRRYPDTFSTGTFVGPSSIYLDGGCAATSLN